MAYHPVNLLFRFALELSCLIAVGIWGWIQGAYGIILAFCIPLAMMVIWGVFAVPDDRSRSGKAPVPTPGPIRLIIELLFFSFGVWALADMGSEPWNLIFGLLVCVHYLVSYNRVVWLIRN